MTYKLNPNFWEDLDRGVVQHYIEVIPDESTDYADCQNGYDYFRRMGAFTGTPEEVAEKQAKLGASFRSTIALPKDFIWHV